VIEQLRQPLFTTVMFFGLALGTNAAQLPFGSHALINIFVSVIVASWIRA
jgi:MscS family membrane protein